jgi:uncharacterized protein (TIGR02722 family)
MRRILGVIASVLFLALSGCGPQAFVNGKYDDVNRANLMTDTWSESDMQVVAQALVDSMVKHPAIASAKNPPLVMVTNLQNKTSEHIDTQSIMDMVRVSIMKSGKVAFIDKEAREDIKSEYDYQNSGMVSDADKKGPGSQKSADFIVNGRLDSIVQEVGKDKTVYYKITLNLTNLKSSVIVWTDQKEIRKAFRKKSVGL